MTERRLPPSGIMGTAELTPAEVAPFREAGQILRADSRVRAAWGFDSRARGGASPRSDVDIALWLGEKPSLMEKLRLLRYEAVSAGCRLLARDDEAADDFELRCLREYLDTRYLRDLQRRLSSRARPDEKAGLP
ncbi:MAG: nucleotidyltransferase domain-containing protein [Holophagales bacterium]|nr:nucleotidyltransferase domain-containing protein [Holophagales bacterium]